MLPPGGEIDDGVIGGGENIAGADDIGAAEEHDAIAVGVGRGLMQDVDAFAIEVQLLLIAQERVGGPATLRATAPASRWARSCD